jgi:hypothetical protein
MILLLNIRKKKVTKSGINFNHKHNNLNKCHSQISLNNFHIKINHNYRIFSLQLLFKVMKVILLQIITLVKPSNLILSSNNPLICSHKFLLILNSSLKICHQVNQAMFHLLNRNSSNLLTSK